MKLQVKETTNVTEQVSEETKTHVTKETAVFKTKREEEEHKFSKQLADIKAQIAAMEEQAPPDLQSQLLNIHDHLEKIVKLKLMQSAQYKEVNVFYYVIYLRNPSERYLSVGYCKNCLSVIQFVQICVCP